MTLFTLHVHASFVHTQAPQLEDERQAHLRGLCPSRLHSCIAMSETRALLATQQCCLRPCRCCNMLADLWNNPPPATEDPQDARLGTSTLGSSEACILGGLAMKRAWQERRRKEGKDASKPNLVLGSNAQVCWEVRMSLYHAV